LVCLGFELLILSAEVSSVKDIGDAIVISCFGSHGCGLISSDAFCEPRMFLEERVQQEVSGVCDMKHSSFFRLEKGVLVDRSGANSE
jgi:hypothetical protein